MSLFSLDFFYQNIRNVGSVYYKFRILGDRIICHELQVEFQVFRIDRFRVLVSAVFVFFISQFDRYPGDLFKIIFFGIPDGFIDYFFGG